MSGLSFDTVLDRVSSELEGSLVFAGALDNNAKLLGFRKGTSKMALPVERHETLDVQISLLFSLLHQLEDIAGPHTYTVTRFGKYNIFLFGTNDIHLFIVSNPDNDANISRVMSGILRNETEESDTGPRSDPRAKVAAALAPVTAKNPPGPDRSKFENKSHARPVQRSNSGSKPGAIMMLEGYFLGTGPGLEIDEDSEGYIIRSSGEGGAKVPFSLVERINSTFGDKIEIVSFDNDKDGRPVIRIIPKE